MSSLKCICCRTRKFTRTLYKNGKALQLCDFCDTQKPPAKKKPPAAKPKPARTVRRITRSVKPQG